MKYILLILVTILLVNNLIAQSTSDMDENKLYRCQVKVKFKKVKPGEDMQYIYYPLPRTNDYQVVSNFNTYGGEIFDNPDSIERYVRYTITDDLQPAKGEWGEVKIEFDFMPTSTEYFSQNIDRLYPYNTDSDIYKRYTGKYYDILEVDNAAIKKMSDTIWKKSKDIYDYAKKCFNHVVNNFAFQDSPAIWISASKIIEYKGGDCGDLSTMFITLLRCKKIPTRYVITRTHAWAEFYLEKHGWIPVDPTFKTFGKVKRGFGLVRSNEPVYFLKTLKDKSFREEFLVKSHIFYPSHNPYECDVEILPNAL